MHLWKRAMFLRATGTSKIWISRNDALEDILVGIEVGDFPFFQAKSYLFTFVWDTVNAVATF
jgi:hypothetical protein